MEPTARPSGRHRGGILADEMGLGKTAQAEGMRDGRGNEAGKVWLWSTLGPALG